MCIHTHTHTLFRKAYTGTLVPQNVPHEIVLGVYKKYDYQLALTVSYVFEYYPRIDNPAASFSRRLKSVMCSKDFSDPELLVSWWCTFRLLCVFTDYSRW